MPLKHVRSTAFGLFPVLLALHVASAQALEVAVEGLRVTKNTSVFLDDFADGNPPPSGPLGSVTYFLQGSFTGSEFDSRLHLDTSRGVDSSTATGQPRVVHSVLLNSGTGTGNTVLGVLDDISVQTRFDLVTPSTDIFSGYGIQLTDVTPTSVVSQLLQLYVFASPTSGGPRVAFILQDFTTDTLTTFGSDALAAPAEADQIQLDFLRVRDGTGALTNNFAASYGFYDGGILLGSATTFANVGTMFDGEDYLRVRVFAAAAPIPEPSTYLLMIAGLLGMAAIARRRAS